MALDATTNGEGSVIEEVVARYVKLRDAKAKIVNEAKEKTAKIDEVLKKLEAFLLTHFQETGAEAVRTKAGTAYKSVKTSATVADWDQVLAFIRENEMWQMLERRVSKDAVQQFVEEHNDLPPGVNWREEIAVNIRRA